MARTSRRRRERCTASRVRGGARSTTGEVLRLFERPVALPNPLRDLLGVPGVLKVPVLVVAPAGSAEHRHGHRDAERAEQVALHLPGTGYQFGAGGSTAAGVAADATVLYLAVHAVERQAAGQPDEVRGVPFSAQPPRRSPSASGSHPRDCCHRPQWGPVSPESPDPGFHGPDAGIGGMNGWRAAAGAILSCGLLGGCHHERVEAPVPFARDMVPRLGRDQALERVAKLKGRWAALGIESYSYVLGAYKPESHTTEFTIVGVEAGRAKRRVFAAARPAHGAAGHTEVVYLWDEAADAVGSHREGFDPMTMEQLLRYCRDVVIAAGDQPIVVAGENIIRRCWAPKAEPDSPFLVVTSFTRGLPPKSVPACHWTCLDGTRLLLPRDSVPARCNACTCHALWSDLVPRGPLPPCKPGCPQGSMGCTLEACSASLGQ
jgi:hypothetical protein